MYVEYDGLFRDTVLYAKTLYKGFVPLAITQDYTGTCVNGTDNDLFKETLMTVDWIEINAYYELSESYELSYSEIAGSLDDIIPVLENISSYYGKDIVFGEIGYRSNNGTLMKPWEYTSVRGQDYSEQLLGHKVFFEKIYGYTWFRGTFL